MKVVMVSGGFDPIHVGHLRMFQEASKLGDKLIVVINNDNWLNVKKGYSFMNENDRQEIIQAFECVEETILTKHNSNCTDMSVCQILEELRPDIFANGGDRNNDIPEFKTCKRLGIHMEFNVGGNKVRSSSKLIKDISIQESECHALN